MFLFYFFSFLTLKSTDIKKNILKHSRQIFKQQTSTTVNICNVKERGASGFL